MCHVWSFLIRWRRIWVFMRLPIRDGNVTYQNDKFELDNRNFVELSSQMNLLVLKSWTLQLVILPNCILHDTFKDLTFKKIKIKKHLLVCSLARRWWMMRFELLYSVDYQLDNPQVNRFQWFSCLLSLFWRGQHMVTGCPHVWTGESQRMNKTWIVE